MEKRPILCGKDLTMANCKFCGIVSPSRGSGARAVDQIVLEDERYFAISSIGGFVPGWTLVCTKAHELNLAAQYSEAGFHDFLGTVIQSVSREFGRPVIFEHGAQCEGSSTACGTNHAHLHVVPFSKSIEKLASSQQLEGWQTSLIGDVDFHAGRSEYLYCADEYKEQQTIGVMHRLSKPESQFFRRVIAKSVGLPEFFDYKTNQFEELSAATASKLKESLLQAHA